MLIGGEYMSLHRQQNQDLSHISGKQQIKNSNKMTFFFLQGNLLLWDVVDPKVQTSPKMTR